MLIMLIQNNIFQMTEEQLSVSQQLPGYSKQSSPQMSMCKVFSTGCLYSSTITVLTDQSTSFKQHWSKTSQHHFMEIEKYKLVEKRYHKTRGKLWENILESFNTKTDIGILYYLLNQIWIPYIHQRLFMFLFVDSENWLSSFMLDFQEFRDVLAEFLIPMYSKEQILAEDITNKMFEMIAETMTQHKKWQKVDEVVMRIVSRLKNRLRADQYTTPELFELEIKQFMDIRFSSEVALLKQIYSNPSIKAKKEKLFELHKMVYEKFYYKQIKQALEYCFLLTGLDGFSEMLEYVSVLGQCEDKQKQFIETLRIIAQNLYTRDETGFTNEKIQISCNQNVLSRKSWKFIFNNRSEFHFMNPLIICHSEPTWQTAFSWNYLKPNCQIPILTSVKHNFIKIGFITDEDNCDDCRDYSNSRNAVIYCFSTGIFSKKGEETKHSSFKKNQITKLLLKVKDNLVSWELTDKEGTRDVVNYLCEEGVLARSKLIMIFRKGSLEMFPKQNL